MSNKVISLKDYECIMNMYGGNIVINKAQTLVTLNLSNKKDIFLMETETIHSKIIKVKSFSNTSWSFLEISKRYILGDCKALFQIMVAFFGTLASKFPIDPFTFLSH